MRLLPTQLFGIIAILTAAAGCERSSPKSHSTAARQTGGDAMTLTIKSPDFANDQPVPPRFTDDGDDVSPRLTWSGVPEAAKQLALICDDPDAPSAEPWVHWVIYRISANTTGLPEGVPTTDTLKEPTGAVQGKNSWGRIGYGGPAPPRGSGTHHYHFKLYALDAALEAGPGLDKNKLLTAMKGHVISETQLVGTYQR